MPDLSTVPHKYGISKVVRTVILPTIFTNWQIALGIEPNQATAILMKDTDLDKDAEPPAKR